MPLLEKIEQMMSEADLCIFDLTTHNPNVAAEFGIARGRGYAWAILYCTDETLNPKPKRESSVFSDVKGWDSILYQDESGLEAELRRLLPEYLANVVKCRASGNVGATVHHSPPAPVPGTTRRDAARLYLNVKTHSPVFAGVVGSIQKLGSYSLILEIQNKGRGAANRVRAAMTGATHAERLGTLTPGDKPLTAVPRASTATLRNAAERGAGRNVSNGTSEPGLNTSTSSVTSSTTSRSAAGRR
jgi:hypothetical protein